MEQLTKRINEKLQNMIKGISFNTNIGSFARDITNSVAIELVKQEDDFKEELAKRFIDKATGVDLDIASADKGIKRLQPVRASGQVKITGVNGSVIKKGYIVINSSNNTEYEVLEEKRIENISTNVKVECVTAGAIGNCEINQINKFKEEYTGLSKVENEEEFTNGKDIETDEQLRARAKDLIWHPRISWNKYVFEDKALEFKGVEYAHCIPRHKGKGTLKLVVTQQGKETADGKLLKDLHDFLDLQIISDIDIEVVGVVINQIVVNIKGKLTSDFNKEAAEERMKDVLNKFFSEYLFKKKIYYFDIVESIQHAGCFSKIGDITINGGKNDIQLDETKICKIEKVEITKLNEEV